jgi:hypothetical protein
LISLCSVIWSSRFEQGDGFGQMTPLVSAFCVQHTFGQLK